MRKKIASIILSFAVASACALTGMGAGSPLGKAVGFISGFSPAERGFIYQSLFVLLADDEGVDALVKIAREYSASAAGDSLSKTIGKVVEAFGREEFIKTVGSAKIIPMAARRAGVSAFLAGEGIRLSREGDLAAGAILRAAEDGAPGLSQILEEDGITNAVAARLIALLKDANDGMPLFKDDGGRIVPAQISSGLAARAEYALGEYGFSLSESLAAFADKANTLGGGYAKNIKTLLGELGIFKAAPAKEPGPGSDSSSGAAKPPPVIEGESIEITFAKNSDGSYTLAATAGAKPAEGSLPLPAVFSIERGGAENAAVCLIDGGGESVLKHSMVRGDRVYFLAKQTGTYAVRGFAYAFGDTEGWGKPYVEALYRRGIINGAGEGIFLPEENIKREEFVKLIVELFDMRAGEISENGGINFADVNEGDWFYGHVAAAVKNSVIKGMSETEFGSGLPIKRQDMAVIIYNSAAAVGLTLSGESAAQPTLQGKAAAPSLQGETAAAPALSGKGAAEPALSGKAAAAGPSLQGETAAAPALSGEGAKPFADEGDIAPYALGAVSKMRAAALITGYEDNTFRPNALATRQEAAKLIYELLDRFIGE